MRGYYGIGIYNTESVLNVGTLWRSAYIFGAAYVFTIGKRYKEQSSDTLKTTRHIPLYHYDNFEHFSTNRPLGAELIGVEQVEGISKDLKGFSHPQSAIYLLGAEDAGLPVWVLSSCQHVIEISSNRGLNVAVAGSIVMYNRQESMKEEE